MNHELLSVLKRIISRWEKRNGRMFSCENLASASSQRGKDFSAAINGDSLKWD